MTSNQSNIQITDKTTWHPIISRADLGGIEITSVSAQHTRSWQAADYESTKYHFEATATVKEGQDAESVAKQLCAFVRDTVQIWAATELEACGLLKTSIHRAFQGMPILSEGCNADPERRTGINPALHAAQAELARHIRAQLEAEMSATA